MSQLIEIVFNEAVPVGGEVYPEGYRLTIPAEQVFGSHARRQLAPFDLFDSGLELVTDLDRGFYRLAYDMDINIGPRTLRQSDLFYYELPSAPAFGWLTVIVNENGSFTVRQSDLAVLVTNSVLNPGVDNVVHLQFFFKGNPVDVIGLIKAGNVYEKTIQAPSRPGPWQYTLDFNYDGIDYQYPLTFSVLPPNLVITNLTPSLKAGELGLLKFSVERRMGGSDNPEIKLVSADIEGGTPGELHRVGVDWGLEVTAKPVVFTLRARLRLNIDGWIVPWNTEVVVTQKDASAVVVDGGVLKLNLTQTVRLSIHSQGKPVARLTTKSLKLSGSPSYHTYSKSLVKLEDGLYQFSIYTNNVQGTMYADVVVTIDGTDLAIPTFPITVRVI